MPAREPAFRSILRIVLIVVLVVATLYVAYLLRRPLAWLAIALFIAVAVSAPVNLLSRRMRRGFAIAIVYLSLILVPVLIGGVLIPPIVTQANELVGSAPQYATDATNFVNENSTLNGLQEDYDITGKLQEEAAALPGKIGDAAGVLRDVGVGVVNSVFAGVTILILSVFMVGGGPRWTARFLAAQPPDRAERLERALKRMSRAVGSYVAGALVQATIAGVTTYIVLLILGVPFAGPLAVVVFLLDLIPLIGATLAAIIVGIVTLFANFPVATIVWVVWAIVYQQVENNVIQPQIQKRAVQIEPFVVLVAVLFGATLFGVIGALLAIPVAASVQIAVREWLDYRRDGRLPETQSEAGEPPAPGGRPPPSRPPSGGEPGPAPA